MCKYYDVTFLGPKNRRAQYRERQKSEEERKDKRGKENRKGEKSGGGHRGNKINPMVKKSSNFEASVYYHIIYWCY